jgi:hypothetical protein
MVASAPPPTAAASTDIRDPVDSTPKPATTPLSMSASLVGPSVSRAPASAISPDSMNSDAALLPLTNVPKKPAPGRSRT